MMRTRVRSATFVLSLLVIVGVAVVAVQTMHGQSRTEVRSKIYSEALAAIEDGYVEPLDAHCTNADPCGAEALVYDSIEGMLRTLDPHSTFFSPRDFRALRERQEGHYAGIGITIGRIGNDVVVSSVFEGSPANKVGIRRGDVIARVGQEQAKSWTTQDVVDRVKGPKGTSVDVGIRRPGLDQEIAVTVPRDEIRIPSVRTFFMVNPTTGYVRLQDFSETTNTELGDALSSLKTAGMQQLVLDLRDNPGGPLDQAIRVASRFLKKDEAVVSTKGRIADADHNYGATSTGGYTDVPMVVLVDRQSASASEIVTGAMQDHDRGLVVGETTFGKALVQTVFSISNGAGLALTTGHYYTPSGRMIQRPWDGSFDEYLTYQFRDQNTTPTHTPAQMHETDSHRKVFEGGGIEPDHFVIGPIEGFNPNRFSRLMRDTGRFVTFAERFAKAGDDRPGAKAPATAHRVSPGWPMTDDIVHEFHQSLVDQHVKMDETAFNEDLPFVKAMIHFEVDTDLFGIEEARRHLSLVDPQLLAGVGYFDEARRLLATRQARK